MKRTIISTLALLVFAAAQATPPAQAWKVATGYSVKFAAEGTGGIFKTLKGNMVFDDKDLGGSSFNVSIDIASINTGNAMMNKHAKGDEWFDAAKYPEIKFTSKKIVKAGNAYQATGELEMHGLKKTITIPFAFQPKGAGGLFTGSFSVNRSEFHIGKPGGEVGETIKLDVSVPVSKS